MLDEDQLYQLGSLYGHSKSAKNQRAQIAQAKENHKLLQEQKELEQKKLSVNQERLEVEKKNAERQEELQRYARLQENIRRNVSKSARNTLADAGDAIDRISESWAKYTVATNNLENQSGAYVKPEQPKQRWKVKKNKGFISKKQNYFEVLELGLWQKLLNQFTEENTLEELGDIKYLRELNKKIEQLTTKLNGFGIINGSPLEFIDNEYNTFDKDAEEVEAQIFDHYEGMLSTDYLDELFDLPSKNEALKKLMGTEQKIHTLCKTFKERNTHRTFGDNNLKFWEIFAEKFGENEDLPLIRNLLMVADEEELSSINFDKYSVISNFKFPPTKIIAGELIRVLTQTLNLYKELIDDVGGIRPDNYLLLLELNEFGKFSDIEPKNRNIISYILAKVTSLQFAKAQKAFPNAKILIAFNKFDFGRDPRNPTDHEVIACGKKINNDQMMQLGFRMGSYHDPLAFVNVVKWHIKTGDVVTSEDKVATIKFAEEGSYISTDGKRYDGRMRRGRRSRTQKRGQKGSTGAMTLPEWSLKARGVEESGYLLHTFIDEGATVPNGTPLAAVGKEMESSSTEFKNIKFRHIFPNSDPTEIDLNQKDSVTRKVFREFQDKTRLLDCLEINPDILDWKSKLDNLDRTANPDFMNQFAMEKKRLNKLCSKFKSEDSVFLDLMNKKLKSANENCDNQGSELKNRVSEKIKLIKEFYNEFYNLKKPSYLAYLTTICISVSSGVIALFLLKKWGLLIALISSIVFSLTLILFLSNFMRFIKVHAIKPLIENGKMRSALSMLHAAMGDFKAGGQLILLGRNNHEWLGTRDCKFRDKWMTRDDKWKRF
jgi:hypothetical protein